MSDMRRREFITLLAGAAGWPLAARAKDPGRVYRLGALILASRETPAVVAFFDEMRLHGFIEGRNLDVIPGGFNVPRDRIDAMHRMLSSRARIATRVPSRKRPRPFRSSE